MSRSGYYTRWDNDDSVLKRAMNTYKRASSRNKMIILVIAACFLLINVFIFNSILDKFKENWADRKAYKEAIKNYEEGIENYDLDMLTKAYDSFVALGEYKDAPDYAVKAGSEKSKLSSYNQGLQSYNDGDYVEAFGHFDAILDYRDTMSYVNTMAAELYSRAETRIEEENYESAKNILIQIPSYATEYYDKAMTLYQNMTDIQTTKEMEAKYESALSLYNSGSYNTAQTLFMEVRDYYNVENELENIGNYYYGLLETYYASADYNNLFKTAEYIDSDREWSQYQKTKTLIAQAKTEYKTYVVNTANNIFATQGYAAVKEFVNGCINDAFSQGEANVMIEDKEPVMLSTLAPYDSWEWEGASSIAASGWSNRDFYFKDGVQDEDGNIHNNVLLGGGCAASYYVGGKDYSYITGSLFVVAGHKATVKKPIQLLITNGDGHELYRTDLYSGYGTQYFAVDISGQENITIYFNGYDGDFVNSDQYGAIGEIGFVK